MSYTRKNLLTVKLCHKHIERLTFKRKNYDRKLLEFVFAGAIFRVLENDEFFYQFVDRQFSMDNVISRANIYGTTSSFLFSHDCNNKKMNEFMMESFLFQEYNKDVFSSANFVATE